MDDNSRRAFSLANPPHENLLELHLKLIKDSKFTLFIIINTIPGCEKKELKNQINYHQGEVDGLQGEVNGLEKEKEGLQGKLKDIS